ncbi:uncharacterized protein MELLADRAFT_67427 [Melampsora larici-populina 98AG31]|uniref:Uncharacterized protein n=1 Tax=Melampsora larici-populina (strain 98AG31 / pathotype 3-4-7) TaxID=747676 RepID=F4S340_MELLP|nr:uncharacterized protein MELLADRAFT_67427 [Melampsora larici-populina 98AG31]EGG00914.1 hypothetical protein MELLADRAFT_67427 [Melampsora larici-populina 98AG31]
MTEIYAHLIVDKAIDSSKVDQQSIDQTNEYVPLSEALASSVKRQRKPKYTTLDDIKKQNRSKCDEESSGLDLKSSRKEKSKKRNHKVTTSEHDSTSLLITHVPVDKTQTSRETNDHINPSNSILPSCSLVTDTNEDPNFDLGAKWADDQAQMTKRRKKNTKTYSLETKKVEEINLLKDSMDIADDKIRGMNIDSSRWVNISTTARTIEQQRTKRKREVSGSRKTGEDENAALEVVRNVDQEDSHEVEKRVKKSKRDRKKSTVLGVDSQHPSMQKGIEVEPKSSLPLAAIDGSELQQNEMSSKRPETSEELMTARPQKKRDKKLQKNLAHEETQTPSRQQAIGQPIALPSNNDTIDTIAISPSIPGGNVGQSEDLTVITDRRKRKKKRAGEPVERSIGTAAGGDPKNRSTDSDEHIMIDQQAGATEDSNESSSRKKSKKKRRVETDLSSQTTTTQDNPAGQVESHKLKRKSSTLEGSDGVKKRKKRRGPEKSAGALSNDGNEVVSEPTLKDQPVSPVSDKWARDNPVLVDATNKHLISRLTKFSENWKEMLVGLKRDEILTMAWLTPQQLQELVDVFGFKYRQGQYSAKEKAVISSTIALYQKQNNLTDEAMRELIIPSRVGVKIDKTSENSIFRQLASQLPGRSLTSIWKTVTRAWEVHSKQGRWKKEEDQRLIEAVTQHGRAWVKISPYVGRAPSDCLDRWRDSLCLRETKRGGSWTQEEEDQLVMIMKRYIKKMKDDGGLKYEGLWTQVSIEMGQKRSPNQCAVKWRMETSRCTDNGTTVEFEFAYYCFFSQTDEAEKNSRRMDKQEMEEDTGFDWKLLIHEGWDRWPADKLRRRWRQIKRYYLRKYHDYDENPSPSAQEIMKGILKIWSEKTDEELDRSVLRKSEIKMITKKSTENLRKRKPRRKKEKEVNEVEELQEDEIKELEDQE